MENRYDLRTSTHCRALERPLSGGKYFASFAFPRSSIHASVHDRGEYMYNSPGSEINRLMIDNTIPCQKGMQRREIMERVRGSSGRKVATWSGEAAQ